MKNILIFHETLHITMILIKFSSCAKFTGDAMKRRIWVHGLKCPGLSESNFASFWECIALQTFQSSISWKVLYVFALVSYKYVSNEATPQVEWDARVSMWNHDANFRSHHTFNAAESFPAPVDLNVPTPHQPACHSLVSSPSLLSLPFRSPPRYLNHHSPSNMAQR